MTTTLDTSDPVVKRRARTFGERAHVGRRSRAARSWRRWKATPPPRPTTPPEAATLKTAINTYLWDDGKGLYKLYPTQAGSTRRTATRWPSGSAWRPSPAKAARAITARAWSSRWASYGAPTPEKKRHAVHPFPGSMEAKAHFDGRQRAQGRPGADPPPVGLDAQRPARHPQHVARGAARRRLHLLDLRACRTAGRPARHPRSATTCSVSRPPHPAARPGASSRTRAT